ncbi:hypothetical protein F7725_012252 [Dissostichus mawsoni]|uniref:Uncharacterized protein n=1 Tax=Dissostichus mawsoni TaxID=36200 RepID=A0A7J5YM79_DISMA|nr:hypothetical protein F7725_012252 [Dissostichus mawsoni]
MPDLQNMCVVPRLPSPSEQSCHSHQSSEYSLSENGSGPLSSHPPPTHSNWLDSQADNRILQQQPLSIQLGQATKHQDKLPTTTLLCTTTATFQSQALPAFMPSQKQERSSRSRWPTTADNYKVPAIPACASSCGNHVWQHAGGNTNPISGYDDDICSKSIVPAAPVQPPYQPQYAPALYEAHQLPATQQPVAQHPVVMPQQSSYGPHNWSVAPSPYTQSAVPQQTAYQSLPVLPAQYAYQPAYQPPHYQPPQYQPPQYQQGHLQPAYQTPQYQPPQYQQGHLQPAHRLSQPIN